MSTSNRTPTGTPVKRNSSGYNPITLKKKKLGPNVNQAINTLNNLNSLNRNLNEFKNKLKSHSLKTNTRNSGVSLENRIYIDKSNNKVYKVAPWSKIKNEYLSYSLLNKSVRNLNESEKYENFPQMYSCTIIPGTKFALLVIEYKPDLVDIQNNFRQQGKISLNNFHNNPLVKEGIEFLRNAGIVHNDLEGNIFRYTKNNKDTFYLIDFESVEFLNIKNNKNNLGLELNANIIKKYQSWINNEYISKKTSSGLSLFN